MRLELVKLFEPEAILICPNFNIQQVAAMFIVHMRYIIKLDEIKDIKEKKSKKTLPASMKTDGKKWAPNPKTKMATKNEMEKLLSQHTQK